MRITLALVVALALGGCMTQSSGPTTAEMDAGIRSQVAVARQDCDAQFPIKPKHNHAANARCLNAFIDTIIPRLRNPDLTALMNAKRLALAEKLDQGVLTQAEADAQFAETKAYAAGEESRRDNSVMQTQAQMAAARAAQTQAINSAPSVPVAQPRCFIRGGTTVCQ